MKKSVIKMAAVAVLLSVSAPAVMAKGGFEGFLSGCCFGLRGGAEYNDQGTGQRNFLSWFLVGFCLGPRTQIDYAQGKDFHWREIGRVIPYIGVIFAIWDGVDGAGGRGRADLQQAYGASYF